MQSASVPGGHLKPLCPSQWTYRMSALSSLLNNHEAVNHTLGERASAVGSHQGNEKVTLMMQFEVHLDLRICLHLFSVVEELVQVIQTKDIHCPGVRSEVHRMYEDAQDNALIQAPVLPPVHHHYT